MSSDFDSSETFANAALGKPATQSSRPAWWPIGPEELAEGNAAREFNCHTDAETAPWWQVDLGERLPLSAIRVHNRREHTREAARTLRVEVSEDGAEWTLIHAGLTHFRAQGQTGGPLLLPLSGLVWARFVKLSLDEHQPLVLRWVEVLVERAALEFTRLRREHGYDFPLLAEEPGAIEQMSYTLVAAPGTREGPLIGLSLVLNPALGNGLVQHVMMVAIARRLGLRFIRLAPTDRSGVLARSEPVELGGIIFIPASHSLPPGGWFLEGFFWELHEVSSFARDLLTPQDKREIVRTIIHPLFNLLPAVIEPKPDNELIIHLRSGDVFSTWVNAAYTQPPLAFYTLVVDRFVRAGRITSVKLVYENRMNPVIEALEAWLTARAIPFTVQSGTMVEDACALINGRHLAFGFGTLGPSICYLSDEVETLVSFANGYDHKFREIPTVKQVVEVTDAAGGYIRVGGWTNSEDQRRLMLEYPEANLRVDGTI